MDALKNVSSKFNTSSSPIIITFIVAGVSTVLVALLIYWLIVRFVHNRKSHTFYGTKMPVITSAMQEFEGNVPELSNGRRFTMTFWIYIYDIERFRGIYRNVFFIGSGGNFTKDMNANPNVQVILNDNDNKMLIFFGSRDTTTASTTTDAKSKLLKSVAERGISLDYIPIQRWVHVGVVVNETVNGGVIQAYIDGELVKNVTSLDDTDVADTKLNVQKIVPSMSGILTVGGSAATTDATIGFSGLISKVTIYNYDLNAKDIYNDYLRGPVDSVLSKVGMPSYGVRLPFKRV